MEQAMRDQIVFYAHHGFADWEAAFILPVLKSKNRQVVTVSENAKAVESMGGLTLIPDTKIKALQPETIACLILPGGDSWNNPLLNREILELAYDLYADGGALVAAICGATVGLARESILDDRLHTSNDLELLKELAPLYRGASRYQKSLAVTDRNLITASGVGAIEFALEIMKSLDVDSESNRQDWFNLFKKAEAPPAAYWQRA
jgi:putative intracellular protease/amidase